MRQFRLLLLYTALVTICVCCINTNKKAEKAENLIETHATELLATGAEPWATYHNGTYYYTQGCENKIILWQTDDINNLNQAQSKEVWIPQDKESSFHLWGPEIHFIDGKWYIYFAADNGNTDNHQIYVVENSSADPFSGEFVMKGRVKTDANNNWAIHASVFEHEDELYMIWSGWQSIRIDAETQCIYIAKMENPWTLKSDRVLISRPDLEWERQWINPDGSRTAYPIYVNEAPQYFKSKTSDKLFIFYNASGNWTPHYAVGLLTTSNQSDLLNPESWTKSESPVFSYNTENEVYSPGNLSFIPSTNDKNTYFIYHARDIESEEVGSTDSRSPRLQLLKWDEHGMPVLGSALRKDATDDSSKKAHKN